MTSTPPPLKVISGFQTGVDQAAILTASSLSLPTGGFIAQGWQTESGPAEWARDYGLVENIRPGYPARTEANVQASGGTLIITHEVWPKLTGGTYGAICCCESMDKPVCIVQLRGTSSAPTSHTSPKRGYTLIYPSGSTMPFRSWIAIHDIRILNVAGPRESKCKGIFQHASDVLMVLLGELISEL